MKKPKHITYALWLLAATVVGTSPAALNYAVDPYEFFSKTAHAPKDAERFEKAHYPLWKFAHYPTHADLIVLGDSRARALRDKYWHEFGKTEAYNFAYGGGTIPEIYETFQHIRSNPNLKTLVVGIQLRSFDELHKAGMNRVPEARKATESTSAYLKNWFVSKQAWKHLEETYPKWMSSLKHILSPFVAPAQAVELGPQGKTPIPTLLHPRVCFGCRLDTQKMRLNKGPNLGLGRGEQSDVIIEPIATDHLPPKFQQQIRKNASSDWKKFQFSNTYLAKVLEIARWGQEKADRQVIFVFPPTISQLRQTISAYGLEALDQRLRQQLAQEAMVVDFDFESGLTRNAANFSDAYHFNAKVARQIVGELLLLTGPDASVSERVLKRRNDLACRQQEAFTKSGPTRTSLNGTSCRVFGGV